jgi:preprotein translocase subunit SecA
MNKQRETIYAIRRSALEGQDQREFVVERAENAALDLVDTYCPRDQHPGQWNTTQFLAEMHAQFGVDAKAAGADPGELSHEQLADAAREAVVKRYEEKEKQFGSDLMRWLERRIVLDVVDTQWKDHLLSLDHLKEGIGLRGYAQKDPIVEFKKEAFVMFEEMMGRIDNETIRYLFHIQIQQAQQHPDDMQTSPDAQGGPAGGGNPGGAGTPGPAGRLPNSPAAPRSGGAAAAMASAAARAAETAPQRLPDVARQLDRKQQRQQQDLRYQAGAAQAEPPKPVRAAAKVGRNDPCPCGSGKKYKKCHGQGQ